MADNICILLGAGASVEQKLPQWLELVKGVVDYYNIDLELDKENLIQSVGIIEDNRLADIHQKLSEANIFYSDEQSWARMNIAIATRMCLKKSLIKRPFDEILSNMKLMRSIAEAVYKRAEAGLMTTIITYNFDDYFEFAYKYVLSENDLLSKYDEHLSSFTIGSAEQHLPSGVQEKLVNVYHVHGCIPIFDELYGHNIYKTEKEEHKRKNMEFYQSCINAGIVFSGNDYNQLLDDSIVGWTNMIQYICYSQLPVTIIGFSLTDANFRMLLRRMQKSKEYIKSAMIFLGYSDESEKKQADTSAKTASYLFKGICDNPEYNVEKFGADYINAVKNHLNSYLC